MWAVTSYSLPNRVLWGDERWNDCEWAFKSHFRLIVISGTSTQRTTNGMEAYQRTWLLKAARAWFVLQWTISTFTLAFKQFERNKKTSMIKNQQSKALWTINQITWRCDEDLQEQGSPHFQTFPEGQSRASSTGSGRSRRCPGTRLAAATVLHTERRVLMVAVGEGKSWECMTTKQQLIVQQLSSDC